MVSYAGNLLSSGRKRENSSTRSNMIDRHIKASKKKALPSSKKQSQKNTMDGCHSLIPDLNAALISNSNKDLTPPFELSQEEDNICMDQDVNAYRAQGNNSPGKLSSPIEGNDLSFKTDMYLDNISFQDFVIMICRLERDGHISSEFRLKFLTWFSLRSTTWHKKVIASFVNILSDHHKQLGEQLVDTFAEFVFPKHQVISFEATVSI